MWLNFVLHCVLCESELLLLANPHLFSIFNWWIMVYFKLPPPPPPLFFLLVFFFFFFVFCFLPPKPHLFFFFYLINFGLFKPPPPPTYFSKVGGLLLYVHAMSASDVFWRGMCLYNIWMCIFTSTFEMVLNLEAHLTNAYVVGKSMKGFRNVWYGVSLKNKNAQQMYSHSIYVFLKILLYLLRILTRILGCFWIFQPYLKSEIWTTGSRYGLENGGTVKRIFDLW